MRRLVSIDAALFFRKFLDADHIPRRAIENPVPHTMALRLMGRPSFYTNPWEHGDRWWKTTGWWLRGLPDLVPTNVVKPKGYLVGGQSGTRTDGPNLDGGVGPSPERERIRSETSPGMARAIAQQWGLGKSQMMLPI